ncbi:hypothetical protein L7F22_036156 [Adiantum nelumboides]|nr:hypothetical protein [Adiantum nelumboides]
MTVRKKMLLDLLQGSPPASVHSLITPPLASLQEELSFPDFHTSSLPAASTSMPLLQILQKGANAIADDALDIHNHQFCSNSQNLPLSHSKFLDNLFQQENHNIKLECASPLRQISSCDIQLAESFAHVPRPHICHSGSETLAWPHPLPWHKGKIDASKPSTSTATSEPSSTLETMDAGELAAAVQESHWELSETTTGDMQRLRYATQYSCQTSLDEGSSMQESLPYVATGEGACGTMYTADEGCSLDNCSARSRPKQAGADDYAIAFRPPARKRKRSRGCKNSEEVESQRITHIAVERNRRRQMNEHLCALRSLVPSTYIQRGDQASIVGGAIDFVKELEHVLQALQTQRDHRNFKVMCKQDRSSILEEPLRKQQFSHHGRYATYEGINEDFTHVTCEGIDVDVRLSGKYALVKVLAQKLPRQLLQATLSIESFHMRIMHLNITTIDTSVLYSFHLEVLSDSELQSANGITRLVQNTKELSDIGIQCISHYDWHEDPLGTPIFPIPENEIFHINVVAFEVRLSCIQGAGYGLFVHSAIESGVTILYYGGPKYSFQEWKKICKLIPRAIKYSLVEDPKVEEEEDHAYILGFVEEGNVSGYINSSHCKGFHPNVRYALDPNLPPWYKGISSHIKSEEYGHICIETICRVEPGEELFADYEFT